MSIQGRHPDFDGAPLKSRGFCIGRQPDEVRKLMRSTLNHTAESKGSGVFDLQSKTPDPFDCDWVDDRSNRRESRIFWLLRLAEDGQDRGLGLANRWNAL